MTNAIVSPKIMHSGIAAAMLVLWLISGGVSVSAQSTFGSVVGVVQDKTQAVVPGASVTSRAFGSTAA